MSEHISLPVWAVDTKAPHDDRENGCDYADDVTKAATLADLVLERLAENKSMPVKVATREDIVLETLSNYSGGSLAHVAQIAGDAGMSESAANTALAALERQGYVQKTTSWGDGELPRAAKRA
jgi:hypothetical protein